MPDTEQTKACAELEGWKFIKGGKDDFGGNYSDLLNKEHVTILFEKAPNYFSRNVIFELIIKYCGDDNKLWAKFALALGKELNISAVWCFKRTIRAMVEAKPRQLVKALLVAAERWVD